MPDSTRYYRWVINGLAELVGLVGKRLIRPHIGSVRCGTWLAGGLGLVNSERARERDREWSLWIFSGKNTSG